MNIAIAGYGIEGQSSARYFSRQGHTVTIVDERTELSDLPADAKTLLGPGAFEQLAGFDMVVRTAGLAPKKITTDGKVWSSTNEFFAHCPAPIIGVTGTKGKGTTASLIASILRAAGKTVHLVGNIGTPPLDILSDITQDDVVVFELSSFQLWDAEKSPHTAVVLMIEPDHLNVHDDFDDYMTAKANIRRYQGPEDTCIYHPTNEFSRRVARAGGKETIARRYAIPDDGMVYVQANTFFIQDTAICNTDALQLPGNHNIENACAAISASYEFCSDYTIIERGLRDFTGLSHRLKLVTTIDGVLFYDDSISTTPGSTIAAIESFTQPKIIILGGSSKGAEFSELADAITTNNVKKVLLMGEEAKNIQPLIDASIVDNLGEHADMQTIVKAASSYSSPGDVVIFSPACASFDMYENYGERGDQFIAQIQALTQAAESAE